MRRSTLVAAALTVVVLSGCGGSNSVLRIFRVALDYTPILGISNPSCYRNNNLPTDLGQTQQTNFKADAQWVVWDGTDKQYLDVGNLTLRLGHAPSIAITDVIEGDGKSFVASRTTTTPYPGIANTSETRKQDVSVSFSDTGANPTGTITLKASYACQGNCPPQNPGSRGDAASCDSQLTFVARRVDAPAMQVLNPTGVAGFTAAP